MRDNLAGKLVLGAALLLLAACTAPGAADPRADQASNKSPAPFIDTGAGGGGGGGGGGY